VPISNVKSEKSLGQLTGDFFLVGVHISILSPEGPPHTEHIRAVHVNNDFHARPQFVPKFRRSCVGSTDSIARISL
jgi:hypothetical protein